MKIEGITSRTNKKYNIERKDGKTCFVFLISLNTFSSAPGHILTLFIVHGGHIYFFPLVTSLLQHGLMLQQAIQNISFRVWPCVA